MLAHALFGNAASAQFEFAAIFESQVEPQNRDFALTAGKRVFKAYKLCGAYDDLLRQLQQSVEPPRFEFKVDGLIEGVLDKVAEEPSGESTLERYDRDIRFFRSLPPTADVYRNEKALADDGGYVPALRVRCASRLKASAIQVLIKT